MKEIWKNAGSFLSRIAKLQLGNYLVGLVESRSFGCVE